MLNFILIIISIFFNNFFCNYVQNEVNFDSALSEDYEFNKQIFNAKDMLYRDNDFLDKLRSIQVEKNLYSKKELNDLILSTKEKIFPFYNFGERISNIIVKNIPEDLFKIAENYYYS